MYKGERDPMLGIVVRQSQCFEYIAADRSRWVEIFVPPDRVSEYSVKECYPSIMVPPNQVFYVDDGYNEFFINSGAMITGICRSIDEYGNRQNLNRVEMVSEEILCRILQFELVQSGFHSPVIDVSSDVIWHDYHTSGMKMLPYIRRRRNR